MACGGGGSHSAPAPADTDPPEVQLGERLFLETRFAHYFFAHSNGAVNADLPAGDPVMDESVTTDAALPGPFRGQSMNCRACHLVDELQHDRGGGVRTYDDFARRSPIPDRGDGGTTTPRNSPPLVNATLRRDAALALHFDGEFPTIENLVRGTLTGRNFGWRPDEADAALAHIATVIRNDDGTGELAGEFDGALPYRVALLGTDPSIPSAVRIPASYRLDVSTATDAQVLDAVAALIGAYVDSLRFSTDDAGDNNGSPYDLFLTKNGLPRQPAPGETSAAHPSARGIFRSVPSASQPALTDLGLWNVFANPDIPAPQAVLTQMVCAELALAPADCDVTAALPRTIAWFKTPSLRDLGQSQPYLHTGQMDTVDKVIDFYIATSALARQGLLRNGAAELMPMSIGADDEAPLAAFLRSLNEDYS